MANVRDFFIECVAIDFPYFSFDFWTRSEKSAEFDIEITILHNVKLNKTIWYANENCNLSAEEVQEIVEEAVTQCRDDAKYMSTIK